MDEKIIHKLFDAKNSDEPIDIVVKVHREGTEHEPKTGRTRYINPKDLDTEFQAEHFNFIGDLLYMIGGMGFRNIKFSMPDDPVSDVITFELPNGAEKKIVIKIAEEV